MFGKMNELVGQLSLKDNGNYNQCKSARKILQEIKKEAQVLRDSISTEFKKVKKTPKVKKEKEEVKHPQFVAAGEDVDVVENDVEEPKLVQETDDEFFDKQ